MQKTTNYQLNKIELTDSPADITVINRNWDTIDSELKTHSDDIDALENNKFDKAGGTLSGKTTISEGGLDVTGGTKTDTLNVTGKLNANGGLTVIGETVTGSLKVSGAVEASGNVTFNGAIIGKTSMLGVVDVTKGTAPASQKSFHWGIYDKNGFGIPSNRLARVQYTIGTDNAAQIAVLANRPQEGGTEDTVGIIAQWLNNSTARISVTHHPSTDSNDKQVATTYWVRNLKATASQYGLVKLADETALLSEEDEAALTVDKAYELNDFRRMNTAYSVGDKVSCAFCYEFFLECTKAGTTSGTTLDTRNVTFGQVITDGSVEWTVRAHVRSVNDAVADASGNVSLTIPKPEIASQAEAEAGTNNEKFMTPLRTKQAIDKFAPVKTVNGDSPDSNGNIELNLDDYATEADILAAADQALNGNLQNTGQIDLADVMSTLAELESNFNGLPNPAAYITETWQAEDKLSWYRKWSDGWIEQGGIGTGGGYVSTARCNFPIEFADTNYTLVAVPVTADQGNVSRSMFFASYDTTGAIANTSFNGANGAALRYCWYACGQYKQE